MTGFATSILPITPQSAQSSSLHSALDSVEFEELARMSEFWPERVATSVGLVGELHGNNIQPGFEGLLIRVEEDGVLLDFGHNGIFLLPIDQTDLADRVAKLKLSKSTNDRGLIAKRHTKSFYNIDLSRPHGAHDFDQIMYFIFIYTRIDGNRLTDIEKVFGKDSIFSNAADVQPLLLPLSAEYPDDLETSDVSIPIVMPYHREALIRGLAFESDESEEFIVLTDKNGRILSVFPLDFAEGESGLPSSINRLISEDNKQHPKRK